MTQEEKKLLLTDLCARLPYGVKVTDGIHIITLKPCSDTSIIIKNEHILPYLRQMSSMTEDEEEQWAEFMVPTSYFDYENNGLKAAVFWDELCNAIDWLNEHHFDYRNLIGKGLALEAPEGMYDIK